ncbi:YheC/YheD family protein [Bacillus sp. B15-48]|uniref:YheC/YheD family endospore coat-associated protein n=1 Tax=Bacillus sp. B15-48 TaxID=1548601 RepID=UPI00193F6A5C|nr:YheC/YheD family protein [Bacillus sp. B15-48]MBM4762203.1 hypothetical protein [Bacillus sp. B15-48]
MRFCLMENIGVNELILPISMRSLFNKDVERCRFQFGGFTKMVRLVFSNEMKFNTAGIHKSFAAPYTIPEELEFKWKINNHSFIVGPIIAFLFAKYEKSLTEKRLRRLARYAAKYSEVGGLLVMCSAKSVDLRNKKITGYYYRPANESQRRGTWHYGTFPFPEAVFQRCWGGKKEREELHRFTGGKLFNHPPLNKWKLYDLLSDSFEVFNYFPETKIFQDEKTILAMLSKHQAVYLKPIKGLSAKGIYKITMDGSQYIVQNNFHKSRVKTSEELSKLLKIIQKKSMYIAQQPITDESNRRNIVFRVILQKNGQKKWVCNAAYVRVGVKDAIVTNRKLTDSFMTMPKALKTIYKLNKRKARKKRKEMIKVCEQVCLALEQKGIHFADVAFDVMLDTNLNIWVIELNNRLHNHFGPLKTIKSRKMYKRVVATPLAYAGALLDYK